MRAVWRDVDGELWATLAGLPLAVGSYSRGTFYALAAQGLILFQPGPIADCRLWAFYDTQSVTCVRSVQALLATHTASVVAWRQAQAAVMRAGKAARRVSITDSTASAPQLATTPVASTGTVVPTPLRRA